MQLNSPRLLLGAVLFLGGLDLGSKYLLSQELRFHLSYAQRQERPKISWAEKSPREQYSLLGAGGRYLRLRLYFNDRGMMGLGARQSPMSLLWAAVGILGLACLPFVLQKMSIHSKTARRLFEAPLCRCSWILLLSGSLANWIDRIFLKSLWDRSWSLGLYPRSGHVQGVTDFIDVIWYGNRFSGWPILQDYAWERWPVFNLADVYLLIGLVMLAFCLRSRS